jgi:hypothetical protein
MIHGARLRISCPCCGQELRTEFFPGTSGRGYDPPDLPEIELHGPCTCVDYLVAKDSDVYESYYDECLTLSEMLYNDRTDMGW